jgi:hypothetical protein
MNFINGLSELENLNYRNALLFSGVKKGQFREFPPSCLSHLNVVAGCWENPGKTCMWGALEIYLQVRLDGCFSALAAYSHLCGNLPVLHFLDFLLVLNWYTVMGEQKNVNHLPYSMWGTIHKGFSLSSFPTTEKLVFRIRIRLDPHPNWARIRIRNPDPGSKCLKKSQNLLWLTLRTRTEKCSDWAEILTTVSSHFLKNLLLLAIFSFSHCWKVIT